MPFETVPATPFDITIETMPTGVMAHNTEGIDSPRHEVVEMQQRSQVCRDFYDGVLCVKKKGKEYLPQEPAESEKAYKVRLARTSLFPAFQRAINTLVGKPFGTEIIIDENTPQEIQGLLENVDLQGNDLDTFARTTFTSMLNDGCTWILVDYPQVPAGLSLDQERALGARPYATHIKLENVIGWSTENRNGIPVLTRFWYYETHECQVSAFSCEMEQKIRVWEPGFSYLYSQDEKTKDWILDVDNSGQVSLNFIPLICCYANRKGFFHACPALEDLAWLGVTHYQSSSDQRWILHFSRVPVLSADEDLRADDDKEMELGPNKLFVGLKNLKWVETTGNAIEAGRKDLEDLEKQMQKLAGQILESPSGVKTATESGLESEEGNSQLRNWICGFEDNLEQMLIFMAAWMQIPEAGGLELLKEFESEDLSSAMLTALTAARTSGYISQQSYTGMLERAGLLANGFSSEDELAMLNSGQEVPDDLPVVNNTKDAAPQPE